MAGLARLGDVVGQPWAHNQARSAPCHEGKKEPQKREKGVKSGKNLNGKISCPDIRRQWGVKI